MNKDELRQLAGRLGLKLRHRVPVVFQTEAAECGLASLAMVAGWYRLPADLFSLRREAGLSSRGATLRTLMSAAGKAGLSCRALRLDMDNLASLRAVIAAIRLLPLEGEETQLQHYRTQLAQRMKTRPKRKPAVSHATSPSADDQLR